MLVGLFPQSQKATDWLKANLPTFQRVFVEIHHENHPPVTVGGQPPDPSFFVVFSCADDETRSRKTADDVLQAMARMRANPSDFKVMIRVE